MHRARSGKTLFILERRWGNDGYAFWFKLLELLTAAEGHYFSLKEPQNSEYFCARNNFSKANPAISGTEILDLLADLGKIDKELWVSCKVIWCQNLVDGLAETLYKKRGRPPLPKPLISQFISGTETSAETDNCDRNGSNDDENGISGTDIHLGSKVEKGGEGGDISPSTSPTGSPQEAPSKKVDTLIPRLLAADLSLPTPTQEQHVQLDALLALRSPDAILGGLQLFRRRNPGKDPRYLLHDYLERATTLCAEWEKAQPNHYTPPPLHEATPEDDAAVALAAARGKQRMHMELSDEEWELIRKADAAENTFPEAEPVVEQGVGDDTF
jgi:hypothetical protein